MGGELILKRQNRTIRAFRNAGATSAATARSLDELRVRMGLVFRRMAARGIFVRTDKDRWYIDEAVTQAFLRARRLRIIVSAVVVFIVLAVVLIWRRS